jgi:hypothetical protein
MLNQVVLIVITSLHRYLILPIDSVVKQQHCTVLLDAVPELGSVGVCQGSPTQYVLLSRP